MADLPKNYKATHKVYALKREGKRLQFARWLEVGHAKEEADRKVRVFLDALPIGGFSGGLLLVPVGEPPPPVSLNNPQRPGDDEAGDDDEDEAF
ncbi:MAG: hypothetical protein ACREET_15605 [Stellaceae bacterium]